MNHMLHCTLHAAPEAPERLLQVIRIRGFEIHAMQLHREGERLRMEMRLWGGRPVDNLVRQLEKLVGMESVQCLSSLQTGLEAAL